MTERRGGDRPRVQVIFGDEKSRTHQSFKEQCDVNRIVQFHLSGGVITHLNERTAHFGDFSQSTDLKTALDMVSEAEARFMELDSAIRRKADNDPARLAEMLATEGETQILVDAGLEVEGMSPTPPAETPDQPTPPPSEPPAPEPVQ